jgi:glycosyltransferase involved in cell wall biosynthesis
MVIAEAMAAGVPVVASRRALIVPSLERQRLVVAVEPNAPDIARGLESLLESGEPMARKARAYAMAHFAPRAVGERLLELFSEIERH